MNVRWIAPISDVFDETPEEPPGGPSPGSGSFIPIETRSYRPSSWRSDNQYVYQGQWEGAGIHYGCAFFGNQLSDLGAVTVTDIRVKIKRRNAGGWTAAQPLRLAIFTNKVKPAGAPTVHATIAGPSLAWGQEVEFVLPNSWGQLLVDGTCGAVGLYEADGDPYVITEGKATYADAWKLTMTWTA